MSDMKVLQDKLLEIAKYFDRFCREHGIEYCLASGTALGGVRHKGFIPWDDDFDVFMTYENYIKFLECARKDLDKDRFYLQEENTAEWPLFFSKLRMNGTTYIESDTKDREMHKGLYIDLFCLTRMSDNKLYRFLQYLSGRMLVARTLSERGYHTESKLKKTALLVSKILIGKRAKAKLISFVRSRENRKTNYIAFLFGRADFNGAVFPAKIFEGKKKIPFEDTEFPVPVKVEEYLKLRYGEDYYVIPKQNEIQKDYPVHAIYWDVNKDYQSYEQGAANGEKH